MTPNQIQAAIKDGGSSQARIAEELGVKGPVVNRVVRSKITSRRIATHIANKLGTTPDALWPGRYGHDKSITKPTPDRRLNERRSNGERRTARQRE